MTPDAATPLDEIPFVVFDTEMTELAKRSTRLLSIGAVAMRGPSIRLGETFYRMLNPGVDVPVAGILVHQLRPVDVETGGESPGAVLRDFEQFAAGAVLVGHFLHFDLDVLRKEMKPLGLGRKLLDQPAVDTAKAWQWILARRRRSSDLGHHADHLNLQAVASAFGLAAGESEQAHHALDDAFLTARLWQRMLRELSAARVETLKSLLRIAKV